MSIAELETEVQRHNRLYFVEHAPEISDYEFDHLVEELRRRRPNSKVLSEIPTDVAAHGAKVRHETPMLSLDKCYDEKTIKDWADKFGGDIVASPKIDGCAVSIRYGRDGRLSQAATRGDGTEGEEITANAREIKAIPKAIGIKGVEVRGEIYMPLSVFARYKGEFANPRNLAAGAIKQKDAKRTSDYSLSFFAYDLLGRDLASEVEKYNALAREGFSVVEWKRLSRDGMQVVFEEFLKRRNKLDFETDGVVFKANRVDEQRRLGSTAHHPRYAIAYKFQGDSGTTKLLDVEWSVARTGVITPVAIVEPVELSGAMVSRASLHNIGIMRNLGVTKGAWVTAMRRGGVIPNIESVAEQGKEAIEIPKACPSCGSPTRIEADFLYCTRPKGCVQSKIGELAHFVKTVGIDGFGEKLIAKLYESGLVTDPSEFYGLTKGDFLDMERMGDVLAQKLLANIRAAKKMTLSVFLQSLGIRELGRHAAGILEKKYGTLKKVQSLTEEELLSLHTIGPVIAREVVKGLAVRHHLIEKLLRHIHVEGRVSSGEGPLAGKSFLFTGAMASMERSKAQRLVEEKGGVAAQSVTHDLDYLVVGDGGGAGSKLDKAKKLAAKGGKVKIISEGEFLELTAPA